MKYYLDTEFNENGYGRIDLISIGVACEDGREYYAVAADGWSEANANDWVRANVLPHLGDAPRRSRADIRSDLLKLIGKDPKPEFFGYYADYDWVLFCQLFVRLVDLPAGWPSLCMDVKQICLSLGNPRMPTLEGGMKHHALHDALDIKYKHDFLTTLLSRAAREVSDVAPPRGKKFHVTIRAIVGQVAHWATRLGPYDAPSGLDVVCQVLAKKLRAKVAASSGTSGRMLYAFGMLEINEHELELMLQEMLFDVPEFASWNNPRDGSRPAFGSVSVYDDPNAVNPDAEFVDLYALTGNVARCLAVETIDGSESDNP